MEAVTFATQTNSFLLLDADNRPLTPIILWPDRARGGVGSGVQQQLCSVPAFSATTGIPQVDSQFMPAKLLWLQRHSPEIWGRMDRICLISDYLTFLLTGKHVTEAGAAGLTGLVDIHRCQWWPDMAGPLRAGPSVACRRSCRRGRDLGPIDRRPPSDSGCRSRAGSSSAVSTSTPARSGWATSSRA